MSNRTEGITLSLDVKGQGLVDDLNESLGYTEKSLQQLDAAYQSGTVDVESYLASKAKLTRTANTLKAALADAAAESERLANADRLATESLDRLVNETLAADKAIERKADESRRASAAARELADAEEMAAAAARHEAETMRSAAGATRRVGDEAKDGKKSTSNLGLGFLELSRAVEDAQYGFRGVINNIPQLILMFGGSAGLAAAISVSAVALNTFLPKIKEFLDSFRDGALPLAVDQVKALEDRIKELSDKPMRLRVEQVELDEAKRKLEGLKAGLAEYNRGQNQQSEAEARSGQGVNKALVESDTGLGAIEEKLRAEAESRDAEKQKVIAESQAVMDEASADIDALDKAFDAASASEKTAISLLLEKVYARFQAAELRRDDAREKLEQASKAEVGEIIKTARTGNSQRSGELNLTQTEAQAELARRLRRVGEKDVAADIDVNSVANTRKFGRAEEDFKETQATVKAEEAERSKTEAAAAREFKSKLDDELDILKGIGGIERAADDATATARARGLTGDKAIESIRDQLAEAITGALKQRGLAIPDEQRGTAAGVIGDLAADAARAARKRAETADTRAEKAGDRAEDKETREEVGGLEDESRRNVAAIDKEVGKIKDTLGNQMQSEFELLMSQNNAAIANGAHVARTAAEDKRLTEAGVAHAIPPEAMADRLRDAMAGIFRRRGAGEQSANLAASSIADAGKEDLSRRAADFGAQNLTLAQQSLMITRQLQSEYERLSGIQKQLIAEAKRQSGRQSGQRTAHQR